MSGTSTIQLQPNNPNAAIWLGTAADAGPHANELDLTTADLAALQGGFTGVGLSRPVTVGQNAGTHTITIGTATFNDSVLIQAPAGAGNIQWYLGGGTPILSAPNIDFNVPGQINGGGIVNAAPAGSLKIIQSGGIGAPGAPLVTHVSNLEAANSGSGDVYIQNDRDITLVNQFVNNVPNKVLWLETTNGSINTGTAVVSVAGGAASQIVLSASDAGVAGGANITPSVRWAFHRTAARLSCTRRTTSTSTARSIQITAISKLSPAHAAMSASTQHVDTRPAQRPEFGFTRQWNRPWIPRARSR